MSHRKNPTSKFVTTIGVYQWDGEKYVVQKKKGYWYDGPWALAHNVSPVWAAEDYQFFEDDGAIGARTAIAAENTAVTNSDGVGPGSVVGLRVNVAETNSAAGTGESSGGWTLQFSKNGGGFQTVGAATDVRYYNSANLTNGTVIGVANYALNYGGGGVQRDWGDECEDGVSLSGNVWSNDYCEIEYSIEFADTNAIDDVFTFRVLAPDGSTAVTFTNVPTLTLGAINITKEPGLADPAPTLAGLIPTARVNSFVNPAVYNMRVYSVVGLCLDGITPTIEVTDVGGGNHTVKPDAGAITLDTTGTVPTAEITHIRQMTEGTLILGQSLDPARIVNHIRGPPLGELDLGQNLAPSAEIDHIRQMGVGSLALDQTLVPNVLVNHIVTPDTGTLSTAPPLAPSAEITHNRSMLAGELQLGQNLTPTPLENSIRTPDAGSLSTAPPLAPSAEIDHFRDTGLGALLLGQSLTPAVLTGFNIPIAAEDTLEIQGLIPSAEITHNRQTDLGTLVLGQSLAPSAEIDHIREPGADALILDGLIPDSQNTGDSPTVKPGTGEIDLNGLIPSAEIDHIREMGADALVLDGLIPDAQNSGDAPTVKPDAGALDLNGLAPSAEIDHYRAIAAEDTLILQGLAPTALVNHIAVIASEDTLQLTGLAPSVLSPVTIEPGLGALALNGLLPSAEITHNRAVGAASALLGGLLPTVGVGATSPVATPSAGALALSGLLPGSDIANSGTAIVNPTATVGYTDQTTYCQRTNFRIKPRDLVTEWDGRRVRADSYDTKHPQLSVTSVPDKQKGSKRPEQEDRFIGDDIPEVEAEDL